MLFSSPPGYYSNSSNRQTVPGLLGSPGQQSNPVTPGANRMSASSFQSNQPTPAPSMNPGSSNFTQPSNMPAPPLMNQYTGSPNRSTLLRVLLGKTH